MVHLFVGGDGGERKNRAILWILGGMVLGAAIALILGLLIFWAWPAYRKAKSPLGEVEVGSVTVRYLKTSGIAGRIRPLAEEVARGWAEVLGSLAIPRKNLPERIYVYLYEEPEELLSSFSIRLKEEATPLGVVDALADRPVRGALSRLACSLAYGRPGNAFFPRGLALYLDRPGANWAAEAAAYGVARNWEMLFEHADRLLPPDPWERLYFRVNAPWTSAVPTLEGLGSLFSAALTPRKEAPAWEALAAAFAQFVLEEFGAEGVRAFWLASTWEGGARALGAEPGEFSRRWEEGLADGAAVAEADPLLSARAALFSGRPSEALARLERLEGDEADGLRAMAYLALGCPERALRYLREAPIVETLKELVSGGALREGRIVVFGAPRDKGPEGLVQAAEAMRRALDFWSIPESRLPEKIVIYLAPPPEGVQLPWGVIWQETEVYRLPELLVRFVIGLLSPMGPPPFDALVEGLVLKLSYPSRDFATEARTLLQGGRWVSLTQSLSDYPAPVAEAEAGAFVSFILERYGAERVRAFWHVLTAGASPYRAASQVFGLELPLLDQALREWLTRP